MAHPWPDRSLHGPIVDHVFGWCWLLVAVAVWPLRGSSEALRAAAGLAFIVSFAHQPLTLALVYGDRRQLAAHRHSVRWLPIAALVGVIVAQSLSPAAVALIAVTWNAQHTLMQRFGIVRIYGRKNGDQRARLERWTVMSLFVMAASSVVGLRPLVDLPPRLGLGVTNRRAVRALLPYESVARWIFAGSAMVAVMLCVVWLVAEMRSGGSIQKYSYALATVGLAGLVLVDPVVGIIAYVSTHAIEYIAVVRTSLLRRTDDEPVARATRTRGRRAVSTLAYVSAIAAIMFAAGAIRGGYATAILVFGALHILFDGMVWKLRRPEVAGSLGVPAVAV